MQLSDRQYKFNIVLLGLGSVGKSSLVQRFNSGQFSQEYIPTLQDTFNKQVILDQSPIELEIVDTAGQEDYSQLQEFWIQKGDGFLLCYSTIWMESFNELKRLKSEIQDQKNYKPIIVIVGTKNDLNEQKQVELETVKFYAEQEGFNFILTSAKNGENCTEAFMLLIKQLKQQKDDQLLKIQESKKQSQGEKKQFCNLL